MRLKRLKIVVDELESKIHQWYQLGLIQHQAIPHHMNQQQIQVYQVRMSLWAIHRYMIEMEIETLGIGIEKLNKITMILFSEIEKIELNK
jgi:hypothetical protein